MTRALALEGKLQIPVAMFSDADSIRESAPEASVSQYRVRLDPKNSYGKEQMLAITFDGTEAPTMGLHVRSGVAEFVPDVSQHIHEADISMQMSMQAWSEYFVGDIDLEALLQRDDVTTDDEDKLKQFFSLFDQVHPSKAGLIPASAMENAMQADGAGKNDGIKENYTLTDAPFPVIDND